MHNPSSDMYMYSFRDLLILPGITFELVRLLSTFIALRVVAVLGSAVCQLTVSPMTVHRTLREELPRLLSGPWLVQMLDSIQSSAASWRDGFIRPFRMSRLGQGWCF